MATNHSSLKGQLLLDAGTLTGSFFQRTVVLICEHDDQGAFGLVVNRDSGNQVGDMILADLPEALKEERVFLGGPVQPSALSYLHADSIQSEANVIPNLSLGHSLDTLVELAESFSAGRQIRIYAGYAGWAPGQLEEEMKRGAWLTHPASINSVFQPDPEGLWKAILKAKGWRGRLLSEAPEDISWN